MSPLEQEESRKGAGREEEAEIDAHIIGAPELEGLIEVLGEDEEEEVDSDADVTSTHQVGEEGVQAVASGAQPSRRTTRTPKPNRRSDFIYKFLPKTTPRDEQLELE